jgi:hypothetical protein
MAVYQVVTACNLVDIDRRVREAYLRHHGGEDGEVGKTLSNVGRYLSTRLHGATSQKKCPYSSP